MKQKDIFGYSVGLTIVITIILIAILNILNLKEWWMMPLVASPLTWITTYISLYFSTEEFNTFSLSTQPPTKGEPK
jgi:hypothetical protein